MPETKLPRGKKAAEKTDLDRHLDRLQDTAPDRMSSAIDRLRQPSARWVRVPAAILLIVGGCLGFLPVLGFWMIPLGTMLLALDVPVLQRPVARLMSWVEVRLDRLRNNREG